MIRGWRAGSTDRAEIRLALLLLSPVERQPGDPLLDEGWCHLFVQATPPLEDKHLEAAYLVHDVERTSVDHGYVYVDLRQSASEDTMLRALDWLSTTVESINQQRRRLHTKAGEAKHTAAIWFEGYGK